MKMKVVEQYTKHDNYYELNMKKSCNYSLWTHRSNKGVSQALEW